MTPSRAVVELEAEARDLLRSRRLTEPTRRVLQDRLDVRPAPSGLFSEGEMATLRAASLRFFPEPDLVERVRLADTLVARLAGNGRRGWRYADAPPDAELFQRALAELDRDGAPAFTERDGPAQDAALRRLQGAEDAGLAHAFEELLSALTEIYYGHPLVQLSIGYDGMADGEPLAVGLGPVAREARHGG